MKHIPFPSIGQFRNTIRNVTNFARLAGKDSNGDPVYDPTRGLPVLTFEATVKLHGTNAAIVQQRSTKELWFQSRENVLTLEADNAGFMRSFHEKPLAAFFNSFSGDLVAIYGEWCGGNIQKGVALAGVAKRFVVFAVSVDGVWQARTKVASLKDAALNIYNIYDYPTWTIDIDFNFPQLKQNDIVELTLAVEKECPVAKAWGSIGIGEGIVLRAITPGWEHDDFWFKSKGVQHSVSKVTQLAAVDVEKVKCVQDFVINTVTEARCRQAIDKLREKQLPVTKASLGEYIRWIVGDIVKEETDTAQASGIEISAIGGKIAEAAKQWFFRNEKSL